MEVHYSSKSNEWATPQNLFDELNKEFNFTLDPCATDENAKCSKYFTIEDDGLSKDWSNDVVFMNPPYGREIKKWIKKAYEESLNGATVVCLIPARTDTTYWHDFIFDKADDIRFLRGRLKFGGSKNSAPFPSAIVVYLGVTT
ncbi:phage N-6-adenine-methyltransferase [Staphylococcus hominis]|uniref:phage N-6-adenine-methyltransferase n=1 Tax=Staphylococcus hominis TaxID=1290 RepID=UPI002875F3C5|nr:phage N-6-adenine-methyltransferase [Staphylococcus hominis]MDS0981102.1 phage N-6-adenine-methyltransferase [Staphylococcus hominis]